MASDLARTVQWSAVPMWSCNSSLEAREEEEVRGRIKSDVKGSCSASRKRCAVSGKSLLSCHLSGLERAGPGLSSR